MRKCKYKYLEGKDIILNLKKIEIYTMNAYSSSSCTGPASFYFDDTKYGCVDDPDMAGTIKVLDTQKKKGYYFLKVRFKKEKDSIAS